MLAKSQTAGTTYPQQNVSILTFVYRHTYSEITYIMYYIASTVDDNFTVHSKLAAGKQPSGGSLQCV